MAWFSGNISLGNIADLAGGAVNKLQESVKSIEKNFDSALGFEEKDKAESSNEASGIWTSSTDRKALFNPVMAFMGQNNEEEDADLSLNPESQTSSEFIKKSEEDESPQHLSISDDKRVESDEPADSATEKTVAEEESRVVASETDEEHPGMVDGEGAVKLKLKEVETEMPLVPVEHSEAIVVKNFESSVSLESSVEKEMPEIGGLSGSEDKSRPIDNEDGTSIAPDQSDNVISVPENVHERLAEPENKNEEKMQDEVSVDMVSTSQPEGLSDAKTSDTEKPSVLHSVVAEVASDSDGRSSDRDLHVAHLEDESINAVPEDFVVENNTNIKEGEVEEPVVNTQQDISEQDLGSGTHKSNAPDSAHELNKLKKEMQMMENALQGAARQAQAKADDIAKLMNENEQLKAVVEELKRKPSDAEIETLREEYHQRVATLERKVYALTKERDTLRREQNKKSDAAHLLKEKDEIINQVMAEGEELSKKQAAQEGHIRKLRAQIRELEEEKKGLTTKLQVEESKVESIKRDKTATETLLQETIERHQSELTLQKDFYTNALAAAKEAEALAEARINNEARAELETRLREAEERESMLVQTLEELRQTLSRKEQQAVFKEDTLLRDIEDLQRRYQASERRCEELITQVPDSTRPLLRQIEAMQETIARKGEAWAAVERSLTSRFQEAEAKAAAAEERERSVNERLSQTLSRINVLEAQISCLRAEQTQLSKSLEKERQRAAENRQEYLVAKEEADTQEGRVNQLEEEIRELKRKQKQDLHEALSRREQLQQELEKEKAARLDLERTARVHSAAASDQTSIRQSSAFENGSLSRKLSSASSIGSMEESHFLQASLDSSESLSERRNAGEASISSYYIKSMTPGAFEAALRQKEGELSSYMSRLASMEAIRDSLAEELVKMTEQCEKLRAEAATLPGIRAELESLRRRHSAALELMGERDEELEELRADIIDLKEMYREQVNMLVNKIQNMSP